MPQDSDEYKERSEAGFDINHRFVVEVLHCKGPRPSADLDLKIYKHTLLDLAAKDGYRKLADSLLKIAEINFKAVDENGKTPAHLAALSGHKEIVNILIEEGIDISTVDESGWTLLHWAANEGHAEVVEVLLNRGANANAIVAGYG